MASGFPEMLTKGREREYMTAQLQTWLHRKDAITPGALDTYVASYASPGGMTAGFNLYRTLPEDAKAVAALAGRRFTMPVLTMTGRYSAGDKLYAVMRGRADDVTGIVAEDSGHFVAEEAPDFFVAQIVKFGALDGSYANKR